MTEIRPEDQTLVELVSTIEGLYPIDSEYDDTKEVGEMLLTEAIQDVFFDWRDLPQEVLVKYAELCIDRDNSNCR